MYKIIRMKENAIDENFTLIKGMPGNPLASEFLGYGVDIRIVSKKFKNKISYINSFKKTDYENTYYPILNVMPKLNLIIKGKEKNIEGFMLFVEYDSYPDTDGKLISVSYCDHKAIILLKEGENITFQTNEIKRKKVKVKKGKLHIK